MLFQLARFVISGVVVTVLGLGVYALIALALRWNPQVGNFLAYVVAVATGYVMHSRWSFGDHGGTRDHRTKMRFTIVSLISFALNSFWVWLLTHPLHLGPRGRCCRWCSPRRWSPSPSIGSGFSADGTRRL